VAYILKSPSPAQHNGEGTPENHYQSLLNTTLTNCASFPTLPARPTVDWFFTDFLAVKVYFNSFIKLTYC
jgi:hypothetical protein